MARRATAVLASGERLLLADLVLAECVYVLESFYEVPRVRVAELMRSALALPTMETVDPMSLLRALEVYEIDRLDFAEAYLVAQAHRSMISARRWSASRTSSAAKRDREASPRPLRLARW